MGIEIFENTFRHQIQENGEIGEQKNIFNGRIGKEDGKWPLEAGRYRLLWMPACPHAHKSVLTWKLLGLDQVISLGTTGIYRDPKGWVFSEDPQEKDPVLQVHFLKEIYDRSVPDGDYQGRPTVPTLADTVTGKGVNNDYKWLPKILAEDFKGFQKKDAPQLYLPGREKEIDDFCLYIVENVTEGVYGMGFARSQKAYEEAYEKFFSVMDELDKRLEDSRFLFGDYITLADIHLYPTLARFDFAYHQVFRANRNRLTEFKNLWPYARDIYQIPEVKEYTYFDIYKKHYQTSPHLKPLWGNVHSLVAKGPDPSGWEIPADREYLSKDPENKLLKQL